MVNFKCQCMGLAQNWQKEVTETMVKLGFKVGKSSPVIFPLALIVPLAITLLNITLAVVATSCPIATSFALAVTPVPPTTLIVLLAAIVPPPVRPAPAITLTSP